MKALVLFEVEQLGKVDSTSGILFAVEQLGKVDSTAWDLLRISQINSCIQNDKDRSPATKYLV